MTRPALGVTGITSRPATIPLTITHHGSPARAQRLEAWMRRVVDPHITQTAQLAPLVRECHE